MRNVYTLFLSSFLCLALTHCTTHNDSEEKVGVKVRAYAGGPVSGATAKVYTLQSDGESGGLLGQGSTDASGNATVFVPKSSSNNPFMINVSGGTVGKNGGKNIRAASNISGRSAGSYAAAVPKSKSGSLILVTPLSTRAASKALNKRKGQVKGSRGIVRKTKSSPFSKFSLQAYQGMKLQDDGFTALLEDLVQADNEVASQFKIVGDLTDIHDSTPTLDSSGKLDGDSASLYQIMAVMDGLLNAAQGVNANLDPATTFSLINQDTASVSDAIIEDPVTGAPFSFANVSVATLNADITAAMNAALSEDGFSAASVPTVVASYIPPAISAYGSLILEPVEPESSKFYLTIYPIDGTSVMNATGWTFKLYLGSYSCNQFDVAESETDLTENAAVVPESSNNGVDVTIDASEAIAPDSQLDALPAMSILYSHDNWKTTSCINYLPAAIQDGE